MSHCCSVRSKKINNGISATAAADSTAPYWPVSYYIFPVKNPPLRYGLSSKFLTTCSYSPTPYFSLLLFLLALLPLIDAAPFISIPTRSLSIQTPAMLRVFVRTEISKLKSSMHITEVLNAVIRRSVSPAIFRRASVGEYCIIDAVQLNRHYLRRYQRACAVAYRSSQPFMRPGQATPPLLDPPAAVTPPFQARSTRRRLGRNVPLPPSLLLLLLLWRL